MNDWQWNHHDDWMPDDEEQPTRSRRWMGFFIGLAMGAVTLVLIIAMVAMMVSYLFVPDEDVSNPFARSEPSEADLVAANYRPSNWTATESYQLITPTPIAQDVIVEADAEYLLLNNIYERVNPSVVNIEIVGRFHAELDFIDSSGSGFVFDMNGHIVTNSHVVRDAEEILVTFFDGYIADAELVGVDDYSDLAVIRVDPAESPLVPVELGDSNTLSVGQRVIAIGNPFGLDGSMTTGIVSALGRSLPSAQLLDQNYQGYNNPSIIQVDAAVNPGNSGGPLLDSYGRVIGINTAIRTESGGFQGIAFAVPVNTMKRVIPQLISGGHAEYSWLGISTPTTERGLSMAVLAEELGFPVRYGVLVSEVFQGSPAARAGLQGGTEATQVRGVPVPRDGDIIVAINGLTVRDINDLVAYLVENTSPGDAVVLTIVRGGQTLDLDVELGVRP
ncbi:MAG: PDZ domain-containing protein [Chloroflexi bacterium]|nr:PDZ domain-containing protein [Chloroflexota bacterium]